MRRRLTLRRRRLPRAALAMPLLIAPALGAGLAYAASPHAPARGTEPSITARVAQRRIPYGQNLTVTGAVPSGEAGQTVWLEFRRAGGTGWRQIASTRTGASDRFRFHTRVRWSGAVEVTGAWYPDSSRPAPTATAGTPSEGAHTSLAHPTSRPHQVTIVPVLDVGAHASRDLGGHPLTVTGKILPRARGRRIRLEAQREGRWHTAAVARTGSQGRFRLRFTPHAQNERLRVHFAGDRSNAPATVAAGDVTVYSQSAASWYEDGGSTACGFHAYYGVANLSLPCGTKVNFIYNGRSVTATVDDRGPYVSGREWDLNQNTAGALGFGGVGDVWTSQ